MKKFLYMLVAASTLVSIHAFASDDTYNPCPNNPKVYERAQTRANEYMEDQGYKEAKRQGEMFFSKNQKALIIIMKAEGKAVHVVIPTDVSDGGTCRITGEAHE